MMELLTYFKKQEHCMSHLFPFLRSLLSLIRQHLHISKPGIRWPFCAYSFPIKNVSTAATHVSFGSWVAGGLACSKSAAMAEARCHQVHGHLFAMCWARRPQAALGPLCHLHPCEICTPTCHCLATTVGLDASWEPPHGVLCNDLFRKLEENVKK